MSPIPEPRPPDEPTRPPPRIRFKFRRYLRKRGVGSRNKWHDEPRKVRISLLKKLREYGRLTVQQFRSSNGVEFGHRTYKRLAPPKHVSPDIADQRYSYFRLSRRVRVIGILDGNVFLVGAFDFDHTLS